MRKGGKEGTNGGCRPPLLFFGLFLIMTTSSARKKTFHNEIQTMPTRVDSTVVLVGIRNGLCTKE